MYKSPIGCTSAGVPLVAFPFALFLSACSSGGSSNDNTPDTTAPTVDSTIPVDGATGVLTNTSLTATFSEAMDDSTLSASTFRVDAAVSIAGTIMYDAGSLTATFTPTNPLAPGTSHTATLTSTVTDSAGNGLAAIETWNFTTESFIRRASEDSSGTEANGDNNGVNISPDGRYVGFYSEADNLVADDTNGVADTFVHDVQTGTTTRISVSGTGAEGDAPSDDRPAISLGGRYVAFYSDASNLVPGDTGGRSDIFLRDTLANTTTRLSVDSTGAEANGSSSMPVISADGRYVAFRSGASNLVAGDSNAVDDVFLRDTQTNTTTRVSVTSGGAEADGASGRPALSADGRYVVFVSSATNLVANDTNGTSDIFLHDTQTNSTTRASVDSNGVQADGNSRDPVVSSDGRYVAFLSAATNLAAGDTNGSNDVFLRDVQAGTTVRVSVADSGAQANGPSGSGLSISSQGRYVTFASDATNLVTGDTNGIGDIFVRDTLANTTIRVNVDSSGTQTDGDSHSPEMSSDGRYVAFISDATNLVAGDTNAVGDIFRVLNTIP